jgi:hypothetical protein
MLCCIFLVSNQYFVQKCLEVLPEDIPAKLYLERCTELMKMSESERLNWSEVRVLTEK